MMKMPHVADLEDIPQIALDWHRAGRPAAIATVIQTWGSAPRRTGAQMVVDAQGTMLGSVSGGCVEGAVITAAQDALAEGKSRVLEFGVSDGDAFAVGLACGGTIKVLVEPVGRALPEHVLAQLVEARAARRAVAYVADLTGGAPRLEPADRHKDRFQSDTSGVEPDGTTFVGVHNPPLRMVIVGAVHIAQALVAMARLCGHDPILIDPRPAFAAALRFPDQPILDDWPDEALAALAPDARTAVITLTHDPKLDDPAIHAALQTEAYYIGCLGSTRTHAKRLDRLRAAGVSEPAIARIHAPVGLNIGAATPAEIAISVMAQVTQRLRMPKA